MYGIGVSCSGAKPNPSSSRSLIASSGIEIVDILRPRLPVRVARPFFRAAGKLAAVAHPEQQRALRPGVPLVQFAGRMHDKRPRRDLDRLGRGLHCAAALETEIDFGRVRVAMIWADLPRLPARYGDIALGDPAEHAFDMLFRVEFLLGLQVEAVHRVSSRFKLYAVARTRTPSSAIIRSRMMNFCTLPVTVSGNSSTKRMCRGIL